MNKKILIIISALVFGILGILFVAYGVNAGWQNLSFSGIYNYVINGIDWQQVLREGVRWVWTAVIAVGGILLTIILFRQKWFKTSIAAIVFTLVGSSVLNSAFAYKDIVGDNVNWFAVTSWSQVSIGADDQTFTYEGSFPEYYVQKITSFFRDGISFTVEAPEYLTKVTFDNIVSIYNNRFNVIADDILENAEALAELNDNLTALNVSLTSAQADISANSELIQSAELDIATNTEARTNNEVAIFANTVAITALETSLSNNELAINDLQLQIVILSESENAESLEVQAQIIDLTAQVESLQVQYIANNVQLELLQAEQIVLNAQLDSLEAEQIAINARVNNLQTQINDIVNQYNELLETNTLQAESIINLQSQISTINTQIGQIIGSQIDITAYSTTDEMNAAISAALEANTGGTFTLDDLNNVINLADQTFVVYLWSASTHTLISSSYGVNSWAEVFTLIRSNNQAMVSYFNYLMGV